ncbi:CocE/NonD family hydrolase [Streptomyces scopuliridis]|uniref:CocE/NonD family hydrolase n=1 Tax=Streptomyces scopuliridis TaxID=452529 RepID=UPI003673A1FC
MQWAVADQRPSQVKAIVPGVSESALMLNFLQPDAFNLEAPIIWAVQVATQERRLAGVRQLLEERKVHRACRPCHWNGPMSPPSGAAQTSSRTSCATTAEGPFSTADHCRRVSGITVLAALVGGWYDIFLPGRLRDFKVLQDNGVDAPLTVGPWTHMSVDAYACITREALDFGLPYAHGRQPADRASVRLFVTGSEQWRDFPTWPPPGYRPPRHHLQLDGAPAVAPPPAGAAPDGYRYDPADPTAAVGGPRMWFPTRSGPVDNSKLEARADVLAYTTETLDQAVEVIGVVNAEIWFRSSLPYADVFVRLCDVDPKGRRSRNVCDGLVGLTGADELILVKVQLLPTAHRFEPGHRIRVQVSSGAFPCYNRNTGTGESHATATTLRVANQQVFHDPKRPSAITLPVRATATDWPRSCGGGVRCRRRRRAGCRRGGR